MAERCVALKMNRDMLDAHFDGYKLSLDSLAMYNIQLESDLDVANLTDSQYSYQHVKAFGVHNHMFLDPWNHDIVFFVDDRWKVMKCHVQQETSLDSPVSTFQIPDTATARSITGRHNVTLSFPAADWLVLADGAGQLSLIHTDNRKQDDNWKVCHTTQPVADKKPFIVLHSVLHCDGDGQLLECLLLHVQENEGAGDNNGSDFNTVLEWLTFGRSSADSSSWSLDRTRHLVGNSCPDYAVLSTDGQSIMVASEKPFKFTYDSVNPVKEPETDPVEEDGDNAEKPVPAYTWSQTMEDCSVVFMLPANTSKADILYKVTPTHIELGVKNGESLLAGDLHAKVDVDGCTWVLAEEQRLEVHLDKAEAGPWPIVVQDDQRGQQVTDPEEAARIHERLAHLTSDTWNPEPKDNKPAYNAQQLEDCDTFPGEMFAMLRFDGNTHLVTHQVNLGGNQWLFNSQSSAGRLPSICLRHDVDGILWQPMQSSEPGKVLDVPWEHTATFNAFGYVQASKQQKKFVVCAQNYSYVALSDCTRHVYIYRQPMPTLSPLRNRKTGREVQRVSKQQLVSLESVDNILGVQATNDRLYLIAGRTLHVVRVSEHTE